MYHRKSDLSQTMQREIRDLEKNLGRTCRKIWDFTNPKNETYLFGSFCKNYDRLIVTIGHLEPRINKFIPIE